jgi:hypothetical protein
MNELSLELHYHLKDQSHAMHALIRNKCEAEALAAFQYVAEQLGIELTVETAAYTEGGLREIWSFIVKPENAYPNFMVMLALLLNSFLQVWNAPPKPDKELEVITKEIAQETLQEKRLANEKARRELQKAAEVPKPLPAPKRAVKASKPTKANDSLTIGYAEYLRMEPVMRVQAYPTINKKAMAFLSADPRFSVRRSNFYKALLPYEKVEAVGMGVRKSKFDPDEVVVQKKDFVKFVIKTDKLPVTVVEEHSDRRAGHRQQRREVEGHLSR